MNDRPQKPSPPVHSAKVDDLVEFIDKAVPPRPAASGQTAATPAPAADDLLPLRRIDHVRFFVGNSRQSAYFYRNAFGFDVVAYAGLETRLRHEAGYVLRQGHITFVLASPLGPEHPESQRLVLHGDGVQDIALEVEDVPRAYETAVARGAAGIVPPTLLEDEHGVYEYA